MRKTPFVNGEFYHIYNRGVDKRDIFSDEDDIDRLFQCMNEFNVAEPIGSIYENSFKRQQLKDQLGSRTPKFVRLVNFITYCLNSNHYHFILEQVSDKGIEKFMQRLGTGYTNYFNNKHKRSGALFQGKFKSVHIDSNEYLLHLSAYVNLNNKVHQLGSSTSKLIRSSWDEYIKTAIVKNNKAEFCKKDIILDQFKNIDEYKYFAQTSLKDILYNKSQEKGISSLLMEEL